MTQPKKDFLQKLGNLATQVPDIADDSADPVVGVGLCTLQMQAGVSLVSVDTQQGPPGGNLALAGGLLNILSEKEDNERVSYLLDKARRLVDAAYRVKYGEIESTQIH